MEIQRYYHLDFIRTSAIVISKNNIFIIDASLRFHILEKYISLKVDSDYTQFQDTINIALGGAFGNCTHEISCRLEATIHNDLRFFISAAGVLTLSNAQSRYLRFECYLRARRRKEERKGRLVGRINAYTSHRPFETYYSSARSCYCTPISIIADTTRRYNENTAVLLQRKLRKCSL